MFSINNYSLPESLLFLPTRLNRKKLENIVKNKTILITGATFGIGEKLAYQLANTGANLILVARTEEKLNQIKIEIEASGGKVEIFPTDLTQTESVEKLNQYHRRESSRIFRFASKGLRSGQNFPRAQLLVALRLPQVRVV